MNFSQSKQLDRIVETLALSALMANNPNKKVEKRLNEIAFPLEIDIEDNDEGFAYNLGGSIWEKKNDL
tara:strand:- start:46 stop:249 length:204 start_codon:yes stop_codon:yes gene_type:complete